MGELKKGILQRNPRRCLIRPCFRPGYRNRSLQCESTYYMARGLASCYGDDSDGKAASFLPGAYAVRLLRRAQLLLHHGLLLRRHLCF